MKELSIEEKAKAYDKVREKIALRFGSNVAEEIFSEFEDSKDERIRKEIMDFIDTKTIDSDERRNRWFSYLEKYKPISFISLEDTKVKMSLMKYISELNQDVVHLHPGIETCNEWLAWLKKQCEDNPVISDDALREGIAHFGITQHQIDNWLKKYVDIEKQDEQKSLDDVAKEVVKDKDAAISFLKSTGIMNENGELADEYKIEQGEQKPAWSEEDEWKFSDILALLRGGENCHYNTPDLFDWLKSLKDRYTWKPSDEQLDALQYVYRNSNPSLFDKLSWNSLKTLELLYNDLKKLKLYDK